MHSTYWVVVLLLRIAFAVLIWESRKAFTMGKTVGAENPKVRKCGFWVLLGIFYMVGFTFTIVQPKI